MQIPFSINCKGRMLSLAKPIVMGIVNATPDSFFNKGQENSLSELLLLTEKMLTAGASIIDVGGMSSRPGAAEISEHEELIRVIPLIENIKTRFPQAYISIDTYRSKVAKLAIEASADIINDISAGTFDIEILKIAAEYKTPYIAMHMQGKPINMQLQPSYEQVSQEVYDFFVHKIKQCHSYQINDVIVDVGFGFGKTVAHNAELLGHLALFKNLYKPLLVGISRKSMICKPLNISPAQALNGTTALHMLALQQGASILRVHDVKEAIECIKLYEIYSQYSNT